MTRDSFFDKIFDSRVPVIVIDDRENMRASARWSHVRFPEIPILIMRNSLPLILLRTCIEHRSAQEVRRDEHHAERHAARSPIRYLIQSRAIYVGHAGVDAISLTKRVTSIRSIVRRSCGSSQG